MNFRKVGKQGDVAAVRVSVCGVCATCSFTLSLQGAEPGIATPNNPAACEVVRQTRKGQIKLYPSDLALLQADMENAAGITGD